ARRLTSASARRPRSAAIAAPHPRHRPRGARRSTTRAMRWFVFGVLILPGLITAAAAEPPKLTLEQVIAKALASPRAAIADSDAAGAAARVDEADAAR